MDEGTDIMRNVDGSLSGGKILSCRWVVSQRPRSVSSRVQ